MLIAQFNDQRIDALSAKRGDNHHCPNCGSSVVLKRGKKVVAHFAHKPPYNCTWQKGETRAHMEGKELVWKTFLKRGLRAEAEYIVETLSGDRRADVMVWSPRTNQMVAFELQHCPVNQQELERRAFSYAEAGIAQIWIPFIRSVVWEDGVPSDGYDWLVRRYPATLFEKWVHGLNGKHGMWMYDPTRKQFWLAHLAKHEIYVEESSWYSEGGEENYAGGYYKTSKRYRELSLFGPHDLNDLKITVENRRAFSAAYYCWPKGKIARLVTDR